MTYYFNTIVKGRCINASDACHLILSNNISHRFSECWFVCDDEEVLMRSIINHLDLFGVRVLFGNLKGKLFYLYDVINHLNELKVDPQLKGIIIIKPILKPFLEGLYELLKIVPYMKILMQHDIRIVLYVKDRVITASELFIRGFRILKPFKAPPLPLSIISSRAYPAHK